MSLNRNHSVAQRCVKVNLLRDRRLKGELFQGLRLIRQFFTILRNLDDIFTLLSASMGGYRVYKGELLRGALNRNETCQSVV